uniref:Uncharacterized protein n=1 Tax=Anguilla anguilla TaxID=7936 RepID=A0A0E9XWQ1_ANGAN
MSGCSVTTWWKHFT